MRRDEEFAKEAFNRFLSVRGVAGTWKAGAQPPDFDLRCPPGDFAVEVTQVMETIEVGGMALTERGAIAALKHFLDETAKHARHRGVLHGFYHVHLSPVPELSQQEDKVRAQILAYLEETAARDRFPPRKILSVPRGRSWSIEKISGDGSDLAESMSIGDAKWRVEVEAEIRELVATALRRKADVPDRVSRQVILLLVDAYAYADRGEWATAAGVERLPFHTVARVYGDHQCQVLRSACDAWRPVVQPTHQRAGRLRRSRAMGSR